MKAVAVAAGVLALGLVLAVLFGSDAAHLADAVAGRGHARAILLEVRLPVALLAAVAGAGLAVSGAAYQAVLRNPLAEPYVLGVSGGAALGATAVIALGAQATAGFGLAALPLAAFVGGLAATALVDRISRRTSFGASGVTMLLAGVMVNSIAAALITVGKVIAPPARAKDMLRWLVGFVELPTASGLIVTSALVGLGSMALVREAPLLNLLALGEETAASLGVDVARLERRVVLASSLAIGAIVSVTGLIGFVGLVVPHALRRHVGPDHRRLLPLAALLGAAMLVYCDLASRVAFGWFDTKLPVGAVTALLGGPLFLRLLARRRLG
ncbi:MAG: iron ABC transporter permease [Deltaproteobacteria bacterium]|nr:iron ABC transporter permease [Deltaproteobacteria bacterium]